MLRELQKRSTAWVVVALVVALTVWVGGTSSLRRAQRQVTQVYVEGAENGGKGIRYDLEKIRDDSANLLTVAAPYIDPNDNAVYEVEQSLEAMEIHDLDYQAAKLLRARLETLNQRLDSLPLDETAQNYRNRLMANIRSHYKIIESSGYHAAASSFNREASRFPTTLLARLGGVRQLELYEYE